MHSSDVICWVKLCGLTQPAPPWHEAGPLGGPKSTRRRTCKHQAKEHDMLSACEEQTGH